MSAVVYHLSNVRQIFVKRLSNFRQMLFIIVFSQFYLVVSLSFVLYHLLFVYCYSSFVINHLLFLICHMFVFIFTVFAICYFLFLLYLKNSISGGLTWAGGRVRGGRAAENWSLWWTADVKICTMPSVPFLIREVFPVKKRFFWHCPYYWGWLGGWVSPNYQGITLSFKSNGASNIFLHCRCSCSRNILRGMILPIHPYRHKLYKATEGHHVLYFSNRDNPSILVLGPFLFS